MSELGLSDHMPQTLGLLQRELVNEILKKEKMPTILETNGDQWKNQYMQFISTGKEVPKHLKTKYSHPSIKQTL